MAHSASVRETVRRYLLLLISLIVSAFGVAVTKYGELGVSPISSVANVLSYRFLFLSMGSWLILWNFVLIAGEIVILRRDFKLIQLLQIPMSFIFGYFTDLGLWCISALPTHQYWMRLTYVIAGIVILGFGISLSVTANVVMNAGEAFVKAVADKLGKNFGNVKIGFDSSCVLLSLLLSVLFFDGKIVGTREGTLLAAVCTGLTVKGFSACTQKPLEKLLIGKKQ